MTADTLAQTRKGLILLVVGIAAMGLGNSFVNLVALEVVTPKNWSYSVSYFAQALGSFLIADGLLLLLPRIAPIVGRTSLYVAACSYGCLTVSWLALAVATSNGGLFLNQSYVTVSDWLSIGGSALIFLSALFAAVASLRYFRTREEKVAA